MNTTPPPPGPARSWRGAPRRGHPAESPSRASRPCLLPIFVALALVALTPLPARALAITLPIENVGLADSPLPGAALATALCHTCHSAEYVF